MNMIINALGAPGHFVSMSFPGTNGITYRPGRNQPGKCTRWVWGALGAFQNSSPLGSAIDAWAYALPGTRHQILSDTKLPPGAVVNLGAAQGPRWAGDLNFLYGDVVIATGEGVGLNSVVIATDSLSGLGIIGRMNVRQRMVETARPLNGWQSSYGGAMLTFGSTVSAKPTLSTASSGTVESIPITIKEAGMSSALVRTITSNTKTVAKGNAKGLKPRSPGNLVKNMYFTVDFSNRTIHLEHSQKVIGLGAALNPGGKALEAGGDTIFEYVDNGFKPDNW